MKSLSIKIDHMKSDYIKNERIHFLLHKYVYCRKSESINFYHIKSVRIKNARINFVAYKK